mmetsp:Transcript_2949/g.10542  ORF Transcript_2949/g.10542 Transcript_2949/m.10542 type:complete len:205 (-) Transcript_2949:307-921(-)
MQAVVAVVAGAVALPLAFLSRTLNRHRARHSAREVLIRRNVEVLSNARRAHEDARRALLAQPEAVARLVRSDEALTPSVVRMRLAHRRSALRRRRRRHGLVPVHTIHRARAHHAALEQVQVVLGAARADQLADVGRRRVAQLDGVLARVRVFHVVVRVPMRQHGLLRLLLRLVVAATADRVPRLESRVVLHALLTLPPFVVALA